MIKNGVDVLREYALVIVVDSHSGIGPPQESLWQRRTIVETAFNLKVGLTGTECKAGGTFLMEHTLVFVDPNRHGAIGILFNRSIHRQIGRRAMMLRPVELDAATDPRSSQSYEGRFDDMIVIDEMAPLHLVIGHLYATTELRQHHHFDIFILQVYGMPSMVNRFITNLLNDGIWIYHTTGALVDSLLKIHRVLVRFTNLIGRDDNILFPCFYHSNIL